MDLNFKIERKLETFNRWHDKRLEEATTLYDLNYLELVEEIVTLLYTNNHNQRIEILALKNRIDELENKEEQDEQQLIEIYQQQRQERESIQLARLTPAERLFAYR